MASTSPRKPRSERTDRRSLPEYRRAGSARRRGPRLAGYGLLTTVSCAAVALAALPATPSSAGAEPRTPHAAPATSGGSNGIEKQSAQQIAGRSSKALQGASSLHAHLNDKSARSDPRRPSSTDLRLDRKGDCTAGLGYSNGGQVSLVKRGNQVWLRPNDTFWKTQLPGKTGRSAASFLHGRWVHGTTSSNFLQSAARLCDLNGFRKQVQTAAMGVGALHKGRATLVAGTRTVPLSGSRSGRSSTVFVSAVGTPFPLRATVHSSQANVDVTLSDYNKPVQTKTPPSSDSVDVAKLESRLSSG
ncbi:hypothetical protein [Streptomyces sp. TS71-3]|uniref:hypothetical protein n=1 Tax=Streptomyces sp. TS71-3 TaxID=2733862 RepID=UPI001B19BAD7|nr:hypothetical protein [Streptomyces sp. TS71-3]GHJ35102.1 lipoprotein [Streptomyces sp. TS71-3]